jgi:hypothetical protein
MKRFTSTFAALAVTAFIISGGSAFAAQDPAPQPQPRPEVQEPAQPAQPMPADEADEASTATGELIAVDADAQMLTIKGVDGSEWKFRYTEETEVDDAQDGVAGLATKSGTLVTVHFVSEGEVKRATRIEAAK